MTNLIKILANTPYIADITVWIGTQDAYRLAQGFRGVLAFIA